VAARHSNTRRSYRGRHRKPPQRQRVIVPAVTSLAVFSLGGVALAHAVSSDSTPGSAGAAIAHNDVRLFPAISVLPPPSGAPQPTTTQAHHVPAALRIVDVHGPCYVQVTRHGKLLTRQILRQGHQLTFKQHGLNVVLGNAGAVRLRINGHHAVRGGHTGQVRLLRVR
jgi:hypothetical protein